MDTLESAFVQSSHDAAPASGVRVVRIDVELQRLVVRQMRAFAGYHADLPDLVQEALLVLEATEFRGESSLSTFVRGVCYRVWLRHLRWSSAFKRNFLQFFGDGCPVPVEESTPEVALESLERAERVNRALRKVGKVRRAVVVLKDLEDLDFSEIARIVGAKETTVRSRYRDGRARLSTLLANDPYFGDRTCVRSR